MSHNCYDIYILPESVILWGFFNSLLKTWRNDWRALALMTDKLAAASSQLSMHKVIHLGRADFTIAEFTASLDMERNLRGYILYPVDGIKVRVPGSRHFVVSKKSERSEVFLQILSEGIARLRESGEVRKQYTRIGFFSERVQEWRVINAN